MSRVRDWMMPLLSLAAAAMCMLPAACSHTPKQSELARLDREANKAMARLVGTSTDSLATLLLGKATEAGDKVYQGKAHLYLSKFYWDLDSSEVIDRLSHLDQAEAIAHETHNDTLLAWVYNQRGVWEMVHNLAPVTARYWFNKSVETATSLGERWLGIPAEINMSQSCMMTGDTMGIQYDRDLFEYAIKSRRPEHIRASGFNCAVYYARIVSDTAMLRPYLDAVESLSENSQGVRPFVYAIFFYHKGQYAKAADMMVLADPMRYRDYSLFYAEILSRLGRYDESDRWVNVNDSFPGVIFSDSEVRSIRIKAVNAAGAGRWSDAYHLQKTYEEMRDSIDASNTRDLSRRYKVEYEVNIKDRQLAEQRMRIRNMATTITLGVVIIILVVVGYSFYHRRKTRFYRDIVRQNMAHIEKETLLEGLLAQREAEIASLVSDRKDASSDDVVKSDSEVERGGLTDDKTDRIFAKIRELTEVQQVWRDVSITRESFADMVGCNRTYFTEVIKRRTGMTYTQYMNSCRIKEAVRILSNADDDTPLKEISASLGFLSIGTFYTAFKQETGITPAAYRKTARELRRE